MEDFTFLNSESLGTNQYQQANAYGNITNHTQRIDMVIERTGDSGGFFLGVRCRDCDESERQVNSRHIIKLKHDLTEVMWTYTIMSYKLYEFQYIVNEKDYFIVDDLGKNVYTINYTASGFEFEYIKAHVLVISERYDLSLESWKTKGTAYALGLNEKAVTINSMQLYKDKLVLYCDTNNDGGDDGAYLCMFELHQLSKNFS